MAFNVNDETFIFPFLTVTHFWVLLHLKLKMTPSMITLELQFPPDTTLAASEFTLTHLTSGFLLPCEPDGLRDPAECRSGVLERSGGLLLRRGGPGRHRGVPAGALPRGPVRALYVDDPQHGGPASQRAPLPGHQDHR